MAEADIVDIWDYIAEDSLDEADRWLDRLDEKLALWATQPAMARQRDELAPGIRGFAFGRYVVVFQALPDGIDVVRVLHASRDIGGGSFGPLRARKASDLRTGLKPGQQFDVDWVDIARPADGVGDNGYNGVLLQGRAQGGSLFTRLEGLHAGRDEIFFTSTDGGDAQAGQVWRFIPGQQRLQLFLESPGASVFDYPDNLCLHPRQDLIVVCEDSKQPVQRLYGLRRESGLAGLFELARNNVQLAGEPFGLKGDFRGAEWAGTCFSADGRTLFANVYRPGFTVAISGPFMG